MAALLTIRNEGPDEAVVLIGGRVRARVPAGRQIQLSTSAAVSFEPVKKLTPEELAMHHGLPADHFKHNQRTDPGQYAAEDM